MSRFDRVFSRFAPCFGTTDPRADRQPDRFYQLDLEMSFVNSKTLFRHHPALLTGIFEEFVAEKVVDQEWAQILYKGRGAGYGSDKPDLRNPIKMQIVSDPFRRSQGFAIFASCLSRKAQKFRAIPAPKGGSQNSVIALNAFAQKRVLPGMGYIFLARENRD